MFKNSCKAEKNIVQFRRRITFMDDFELRETLDDIEHKLLSLQKAMDSFVSDFNSKLQEQMELFIDCIQEPSDDQSKDKYDYVIKLLCSLGYGQSCILENQRKILELLGSKNVGIRTMSLEDKRRRVEKILNEIQDPYQKKGGKQ